MTSLRFLGIESSCDETAAAVVENGRIVHSSVVASQIPLHARFGGVVPEVASRQHVLAILSVVEAALEEPGFRLGDLDGIGVTFGPGLAGPLLVGTNFAKGLSLAAGLPLHAVNHIEGHILSIWLRHMDDPDVDPEMPLVSLVASGGHTQLVLVRSPGEYVLLGQTLDDAAGEAFDKVGRLLGLPFPGGPSIERVASTARRSRFDLPRAWLPGTLDFSFSGLKTAALRLVRTSADGLSTEAVSEVAWEFQESVADVLSTKLKEAVEQTGASSAAIVGGVGSNRRIRELAEARLAVPLFFPGPGMSTDNAAMIAGAAFWDPNPASLTQDIEPSMSFGQTFPGSETRNYGSTQSTVP